MPYRCSYYNVQLSTCRNISIESMFNRASGGGGGREGGGGGERKTGGNRDCKPGSDSRGREFKQTYELRTLSVTSQHHRNDTIKSQTRYTSHSAGPFYNNHTQFQPNPFPWVYYPTPFNIVRNRFVGSAPNLMIPFRAMTTPIGPWNNDQRGNIDGNQAVKRHRYDVPNVSGYGYRTDSHNGCYQNHRHETLREKPNSTRDHTLSNLSTEDKILNMKKMVDSIRQWDYTEKGISQRKNPQPGLEFSIVSYNVLAQCLLEDNIYLYTHCQENDIDWNNRKETLVEEFRQSEADILCLQEVQCDHYEDFFKPKLSEMGYKSRYKKRTGNKKDGCAIFYKKNVFKLEKWTSVEYCKAGIRLLDRDNIALILMLRRKGGNEMVCVVNTHLLFNPGRGDIKLAQMRILMAEVDNFAFRQFSRSKRAIYYPVIMCGDMNSKPNCHLYTFMSTGTLDYEGLVAGDISGQAIGRNNGRFYLNKELVPSSLGISDHCQYVKTVQKRVQSSKSMDETKNDIEPNLQFKFSSGRMSHQLNLISSYSHKLDRLGGQPEVTIHLHKNSGTVDYIFYSVHKKYSIIENQKVVHRDVLEGSLQLLATYGLLSCKEVDCLGGLPNAVQPSDHLPLIARFLLRS